VPVGDVLAGAVQGDEGVGGGEDFWRTHDVTPPELALITRECVIATHGRCTGLRGSQQVSRAGVCRDS
jgi:hypothetical protein